LRRREKAGIILAKDEKASKKRTYPKSHDTVFSPPKASGGVHEQIESFLETAMQGMISPHDQQAAAEQADKPGRPMVLLSPCSCFIVLLF